LDLVAPRLRNKCYLVFKKKLPTDPEMATKYETRIRAVKKIVLVNPRLNLAKEIEWKFMDPNVFEM